jgi:hypothetical protein
VPASNTVPAEITPPSPVVKLWAMKPLSSESSRKPAPAERDA